MIDFLEGKLGEEERRQVERFLAANPDIASEYETLKEEDKLQPDGPQMEKGDLFRSLTDVREIHEGNFEEFCIAWYEGDLDKPARIRLTAFLNNHPEKKDVFELYGILKAIPNTSIVFPDKRSLKKQQIITLRRVLYGIAATAALLAGFIGIMHISQRENGPAFTKSASHTERIIPQDSSPVSSQQVVKQTGRNLKDMVQPQRNKMSLLATIDTSAEANSNETVIIAKADSNSRPFDVVILADIKPLMPELRAVKQAPLPKPETGSIAIDRETRNDLAQNETGNEKRKFTLERESILVGVLQAGVKGFNTLTENDMKVDATRNEDGKFTQIAINAENFEFARKLNKNIQN